MDFRCINVGFRNIIIAHRVIAVMNADSAPMKRLRQEAKTHRMLIDLTEGRKTRSLILLDTNHVVLSYIQTETLTERLSGASLMEMPEDDEEKD